MFRYNTSIVCYMSAAQFTKDSIKIIYFLLLPIFMRSRWTSAKLSNRMEKLRLQKNTKNQIADEERIIYENVSRNRKTWTYADLIVNKVITNVMLTNP